MENKLMIFENEAFGKVRTLNLNGEPWFVAADVCKALELGNPSMTVERLDDDEKGISTILPCNRKRNEHPDRRPLVSLYVLQSPLRDRSISAL